MTKLPESEEKYRTLFEVSPLGITTLNMKGVITSCNDAVYKEGGYSPGEIIGKHFSKIAPLRIRDIPKHIRTFASVIRGKPIKPFEVLYHRKDRTNGWAEIHIALMKADGKKKGILVIQNDITERKQAEETLRQSEAKYKGLVTNVKLGIFRSTQGRTGRFLEVNPAMEEIAGYSRKELLQMKVSDLYVHPEKRGAVLRKVVSATGKVTNELHFRKKAGAEIVVSDTKVAVKDDKGKVIFFDGIIEDITERKRMEEALHLQAEIIANMSEAVYIVRASDGVIIYTNPKFEEMFGYKPSEMVGKHVSIVNAPTEKSPAETAKEIIESINKTGGWRSEIQNIKKDGTPFWCHASVSVFDHPKYGRVWITVHTDITERRRMEEKEKQLQRELSLSSRLAAIGELAAGVAHEINNPLTGIMGFYELLLKKSTDREASRRLERIHSEAKRAARIVQNLLTFARRQEPKKEHSDINDILQRALELRAYELKTSNIKVTVELASGLPQVAVDPHQIQEVFLNIILNAEHAMIEANDGGKLNIQTQQIKGFVRVSFADDGPGIPAEHICKLFDPFFTTRGDKGGTGLGLSICHGIVTEHGGRIYARSQPGRGATFFVELPV